MDLGLADRRILVTGGSRGLGAAVARALEADGAQVAVAARTGTPILADLSQPGGPALAIREAVTALGGLDGLLVNSGGPPTGSFADMDDAVWDAAISGTLLSTIRLIREALPHLREGNDPSIVVILSSSVREPIPGLTSSNALRPGLAGLIKSLTAEIAPIRINGVAPGRFNTDRILSLDAKRAAETGMSFEEVQQANIARIPLGRYGDPDELGRVGAFLLSPAASYVSGEIVGVDGGMIRSLP
jgi:3-oxoacyl-[acyl-carrier protein] reductase